MQIDAPLLHAKGPASLLARLWHSVLRTGFVEVLGAQLVLLAVTALRNWDQLNHDAVAYLRIAHDYATGRFDLAINGYWSPLLSWLITPLAAAGLSPLSSARLVMILSAIVFLWGCDAVLRRLIGDPVTRSIGRWLAALNGVFWSVRFTTPDLLAAGLFAGTVALLLDERWPRKPVFGFASGAAAGFAFLAKAACLPLCLLTGAALLSVRHRRDGLPGRPAVSALASLLGLGLVAGPWIGALSAHYGRFTVSTTARIAHALAAPPAFDRPQPSMSTLHRPEIGRITSWEEPSKMPYAYWSPFASAVNLRHQLAILGRDVPAIAWMLARFDALGLGLVGTAVVGVNALRRRSRADLPTASGGQDACPAMAVWPVVALASVYLPFPVVADNQRFFYAALPFLWVCGRTAAEVITARWSESRLARRAPGIVTASFVSAAVFWLAVALYGWPRLAPAGAVALRLAERMDHAQLRGPIAGSALMRGGRVGLYTAYFLDQPWLGDDPGAPVGRWFESGARFLVFRRDEYLLDRFARDARFGDLDHRLFTNSAEAASFPVKVFAVVPEPALRQPP
jgi:hypothetical protein